MAAGNREASQRSAGSGGRAGARLRKLGRWGRRYAAVLVDARERGRKRVLYAAAGVAALVGAGLVLLLLYMLLLFPFTPGISELRKAKAERPTVVLAAGGEKLVEYKPVNRQWVGPDEIAPEVVQALIATEDHRFYSHPGIDVKRMVGAAWYTLTGRRQGGSTITQQLARNLYPEEIGRTVSLTRKLKEIITALKIEYAYEKDEILETYLNTVPFLYNAYGIERAARTYFDKPAAELDLLESATLVGMLKGTYYYNPVRSPERAQQRRNVVLSQMVRRGVLEQERYEALKEEPIRLRFERQPVQTSRAPHFTEHLRTWLIEWADRHGYNIYRDSLVVHTTLDLDLQEMARQAVARWMPALQAVADVEWGRSTNSLLSTSPEAYRQHRRRVQPFAHYWQSKQEAVNAFIRSTPQFRAGVAAGVAEAALLDSLRADPLFMEALRELKTRLEVGFVAVDLQTGAVKAWIGSRSYDDDQYDHVVQARRQPGSTFKPFVYAAALEEGFRPDDTFPDEQVEIPLRGGEVWTPVNAGGFSGRDLTLTEGLVHSKNTITAQLIDRVGTGDVARLARRMGISRSRLSEVPSLALGTSEVTLLEMAAAYATLASGGIYREPLLVTRIEDKDGNVVASFEPKARRVLSERTAFAVTDMMRGVVDQGTGRRIRHTFGIGADVAGKTGTTQGNADGWFILMHPKLVAGAWVGFNDPRVAFRSDYWGQGGNNALFVVGDFFRRALASGAGDLREAAFPPAPVYEASGSFLHHAGRWIGRAVGQVGSWIGSALERLGQALFGDGEPDQQDAQADDQEGRSRPAEEQVEDGLSEADSLNRMERESTRLNELLERLREQREAAGGAPVEEQEAPAGDEAPEEVEEPVEPDALP